MKSRKTRAAEYRQRKIRFIDEAAGDEMQRRIDVRARVIGHAEPHHLIGELTVAGHRAEFHRQRSRGKRCGDAG